MRVFCVTGLGGLYLEELIHGGAYFRNLTVSSLIYLNNKLAPFSLGWNSDEERK